MAMSPLDRPPPCINRGHPHQKFISSDYVTEVQSDETYQSPFQKDINRMIKQEQWEQIKKRKMIKKQADKTHRGQRVKNVYRALQSKFISSLKTQLKEDEKKLIHHKVFNPKLSKTEKTFIQTLIIVKRKLPQRWKWVFESVIKILKEMQQKCQDQGLQKGYDSVTAKIQKYMKQVGQDKFDQARVTCLFQTRLRTPKNMSDKRHCRIKKLYERKRNQRMDFI